MKSNAIKLLLLSAALSEAAILVTFENDGADLRITASGLTVDVSEGGSPEEATVALPSADNTFRDVDVSNSFGFAPTIEVNAGIPAVGQDNAYSFFSFDETGEQILSGGMPGFSMADFVADSIGQGIPYMLFEDASIFFALRLDPLYITPTGGSSSPFSFSGVIPDTNIADTNLILGATHTVGWGSNPTSNNITLSVVPEVSSLSFLSIALLFGSRRRRKA